MWGDLDGDGKLDVVIASLTGPVTDTNPKSLTILNNTSTPGSVSFGPRLTQSTTFVNRHVIVGDLDGDSKPDITYTSVDDNTRGIPASKVSFFRNKSCIKPAITPGGPLVICTGFPLVLEGSVSSGATYVWKKDDVAIVGASTANYSPTLTGIYKLELTSDGCTRTSNIVDVTVSAGTAPAPTFTSNSPICVGGTINITATSVGASGFSWTGPAGFSATGATITRPSYEAKFAGRYEVDVLGAGGCIAAKGSSLVETISLPPFIVGFTGSDIICAGDTKVITASPADANFTYQWSDANGPISGATTTSLSVNATGSYSFKATSILYPGCPEVTASPVQLTTASNPTVAFQAPAESCKDTPVTFTNQSVLDANAGAQYQWDFGDTKSSTDVSPSHTYTIVSTLTVTLKASYRGGACEKTFSKPIKINLPPTATITTPGSEFKFCEGDKLTLGVSPAFAEYKWSTDATAATIDVTQAGTYEVTVKDAVGCKVKVSQVVTNLPKPAVTATATPNPINLGETTQLNATEGFATYEWSPQETLDSFEDPSPIATPKETTVYTVTAKNVTGCSGIATVEVVVIADNPSNLLKPANFFSPNSSDAVNPTWSVGNITNFPQCGVTVFDEKGSKVYEAKPYLNDWDGTSTSGKKLPDGVYYYVIKCEGDSKARTGSITLLR